MVTSLALMTLLTAPTAEATDIGSEKKFGIGVHLGYANSITGKLYLSEKNGISAHVGLWGFAYINARVQFESEFFEIADWDFARLNLYWNAGVSFNTGFGFYDVGLGGGVGVDLQFHDFPLSVFFEATVHINPTAFIGIGTWPVTYYPGPGARFYF